MSFVYFIQAGDDGPIKIGVAHDPEWRLQDLQIGSHQKLRLIGTVEGDKQLERAFHERLAHLRIRGEWFKPTSEIREVMIEHAAQMRPDTREDRYTDYNRRCVVCGVGSFKERPTEAGECPACEEFKDARESGTDPFEEAA